MSEIPFDPSLVLGNIMDPSKIEYLKRMAEIQQPELLLRRKLKTLMMNRYKINGVLKTLEAMQVKNTKIKATIELEEEIDSLKKRIVETALALTKATVKCEQDKQNLQLEQGQTTISKQIESPLNYSRSEVKSFPLSIDGMDLDVRYFRNEVSDDGSNAHAETVSSHVASQLNNSGIIARGLLGLSDTSTESAADSVSKTLSSQTTKHNIEGTLVIMASCTHMQADIISPCILHPQKTVDAWNAMFPEERLGTDIQSMMEAAADQVPPATAGASKSMHLLTGCAKASSFVGMVHMIKSESTDNTDNSDSVAKAISNQVQQEQFLRSKQGLLGSSSSLAKKLQNSLSSAKLDNHCTLVTTGFMPNISANDIQLATQEVKPDPKQLMSELSAVNAISADKVNESNDTVDTDLKNSEKAGKFLNTSLEGAAGAVSALTENARDYTVIDTNSLMTAFTDYIQKASEGNCGVPTTFYTREIRRYDVACTYCKAYYPYGSLGQVDHIRAHLGIEGEGGGDE
mmetsp:Transcript_21301/g.24299  ORF Transcript_21301/g.24299 Transcript_21301/m.24299 type:complete len:515 (-) Transcript_21301:61-1605(-)